MAEDFEQRPDDTDGDPPRARDNRAQIFLVACLIGAIILTIAIAAFSLK